MDEWFLHFPCSARQISWPSLFILVAFCVFRVFALGVWWGWVVFAFSRRSNRSFWFPIHKFFPSTLVCLFFENLRSSRVSYVVEEFIAGNLISIFLLFFLYINNNLVYYHQTRHFFFPLSRMVLVLHEDHFSFSLRHLLSRVCYSRRRSPVPLASPFLPP